MSSKKCLCVLMILAASLVAFAPSTASADIITGVTIPGGAGVGFSTENFGRDAVDVINGNGFAPDAPPAITGTHTTDEWNMWLASGSQGWIKFDLGSTYTVDQFQVWNYNEANWTSRGANSVDISYSADNITYSTPVNYTFAQAPGSGGYTGENIALTGNITGRYVKFNIVTTHGNNDYSGLAEVRFNQVPEPGTIVLLATGLLGLLAYAWRKRK